MTFEKANFHPIRADVRDYVAHWVSLSRAEPRADPARLARSWVDASPRAPRGCCSRTSSTTRATPSAAGAGHPRGHYFLRADDPDKAAEAVARPAPAADGRRGLRLTAPLRCRTSRRTAAAAPRCCGGTYWVPLAQARRLDPGLLNEDTYVPFPYFYDVPAGATRCSSTSQGTLGALLSPAGSCAAGRAAGRRSADPPAVGSAVLRVARSPRVAALPAREVWALRTRDAGEIEDGRWGVDVLSFRTGSEVASKRSGAGAALADWVAAAAASRLAGARGGAGWLTRQLASRSRSGGVPPAPRGAAAGWPFAWVSTTRLLARHRRGSYPRKTSSFGFGGVESGRRVVDERRGRVSVGDNPADVDEGAETGRAGGAAASSRRRRRRRRALPSSTPVGSRRWRAERARGALLGEDRRRQGAS